MKFKISLLCLVIFFLTLSAVGAWGAMTGGVYKIESDSVNAGGLDASSFGSYKILDTVGEAVISDSTSTNFSLSAGYRQMDESSLSMSVSIANVILSPDLGGISGGTSSGTTDVLITTDNPAGYSLMIEAEKAPAMQSSSDTINDYSPTGSDPDYNIIVSVGQSVFAFTPEGEDIIDRYRDDGLSSCGIISGSDTSNRCWDGVSTSAKIIAQRGARTENSGATTTIKFSVGIGANRAQKEGLYFATTTVTALTL